MKIKIALLFAALMLLQACGSKGMMHMTATPVDNVEVVLQA